VLGARGEEARIIVAHRDARGPEHTPWALWRGRERDRAGVVPGELPRREVEREGLDLALRARHIDAIRRGEGDALVEGLGGGEIDLAQRGILLAEERRVYSADDVIAVASVHGEDQRCPSYRDEVAGHGVLVGEHEVGARRGEPPPAGHDEHGRVRGIRPYILDG